MERLKLKVKILAVENRAAGEEEKTMLINYYINMGYLLDGLFSMARTEKGMMTIDIERKMNKYIKGVMKMWRNMRMSMVGPKVYGVEDHLLELMVKYKGIGCFVEDFVEQAHQTREGGEEDKGDEE